MLLTQRTDATALHTAVDMLDPQPTLMQRLVGQLLLQRELLATGFLRRHEYLHLGQRERQKAQVLQQLTPCRQGIRRGLGNALVMDAAAVGVAQKEDGEGRIDQQDIFHRVVFFLAAITIGLFSRVLGADDAPSRCRHGQKGGPHGAAVTGDSTTGAGASASGVTTAAASATVTPSRCARAARERAGVSPRRAQGSLQSRQQDVNPLIGLALAHAEQASLDHLEAVGLEVREQEEQAILGRGQGAVFVDAKLAGGAGFAIESPQRHVGLEGRPQRAERAAQTRPGSSWSNPRTRWGETAHR